MHAAPSVRVHIQPHAAVPAVVVAVVGLSVTVLVLWFDRIHLPWPLGSVVVIATVAVLGAWLKARAGRAATSLSWDGQRWFASFEGQAAEPVSGQLLLKLDFDGYSLLRFAPERPSRGVKSPRWLMATPANVLGPWQDWRAALIHAQSAPRAVA
jgi:hypothetical protein